jgi:hypothetical protein
MESIGSFNICWLWWWWQKEMSKGLVSLFQMLIRLLLLLLLEASQALGDVTTLVCLLGRVGLRSRIYCNNLTASPW